MCKCFIKSSPCRFVGNKPRSIQSILSVTPLTFTFDRLWVIIWLIIMLFYFLNRLWRFSRQTIFILWIEVVRSLDSYRQYMTHHPTKASTINTTTSTIPQYGNKKFPTQIIVVFITIIANTSCIQTALTSGIFSPENKQNISNRDRAKTI